MMAVETWVAIPGLPDYEISDQGVVRSWKKHGPVPHVLSKTITKDGYERVQIGLQARLVHQLVLLAFVGPRPDGALSRHLDGDKRNNTPDNLAYGTVADNMRDRVEHGDDPNAQKTHCPSGHEYDAENTIVVRNRNGRAGRLCRKCRNKVKRQNYRRNADRRQLNEVQS